MPAGKYLSCVLHGFHHHNVWLNTVNEPVAAEEDEFPVSRVVPLRNNAA
jgi:hypothetical protein